MATSGPLLPRSSRPWPKLKTVALWLTRCRLALRARTAGWLVALLLFLFIVLSSMWRAVHDNHMSTSLRLDAEPLHADETETDAARLSATLLQDDELVRRRVDASRAMANATSTRLGNHFCVLQPTLSSGKSKWTADDARNHIALRAFLRTFATTVTPAERASLQFSIYYGHDSDDAVFGSSSLRAVFKAEAEAILTRAGFHKDAVRLVFTPLYGLHGRINAIWNILAKDAYYDSCDYFFLSNDDMVFFTKGWVSAARDSLNGIGSPIAHKRPCRYFGIVRFKDEWASWATFTFHVSTRMHLEIFGGVYYPVPYNSAHNDYWINYVYRQFDASKYRGEVKVRNRVEDVDYALAHPKDTKKIAPPRYDYDKRGDARKYILEGRARVQAWLDRYKHTDRCQKPL